MQSTLENLKVWISNQTITDLVIYGLVTVLIIATIIWCFRLIKEVNRYVFLLLVLFGLSLLMFYWTYNRNEPAILTPFVEMIAPFLPQKDTIIDL